VRFYCNTIILDCVRSRFLFYDYMTKIPNKYGLYDVDILSKNDETFANVLLFKCDDNDIQTKIDLAENF